MLARLPLFPRIALRLFAWAGLLTLIWAMAHDTALAQDRFGYAVEEEPGFWGELLRQIFTFNTRGLMDVLSKPQYTVLAFIALNVIVFVETGLLVGFFLPGDSLLVITGLICASPSCGWNLPFLLLTLCLSAIIGDTIGYSIGFKTGPRIFNRERSIFFNKDHLIKAHEFYEKHGGKTIILARFIPILRTFAPVVAGVAQMEYRQFLFFNVIGGVSWVVSMVLAGYYLPRALNPVLQPMFGAEFLVQDHVEKVVIIVVILSISPGIFAWLKGKLASNVAAPVSETAADEVNV